MAKLNLDLKKFKHVKSDDKSTTLQHPDGHLITVAHKPLSKQFQQQLAALSKISSNAETPQDKEEIASKMANGGNVPRILMYEGDTPQNAAERLAYRIGAPIKKFQAKIEEADKPKPPDEPRALPIKEVVVPQPQPAPMYNSPENQMTLANQAEYERAFKAKDAANAAAELQYQQRQNAMVDEPIDQNSYKTYRKSVPEQVPVQKPMPLPNSAPQNEQEFDAAATKAAGIMPVQPRVMPQQISPQIQEEPQPVYNDTPAVTSSEYAKGGDVEPKHYDEGTVNKPVGQPDQTADPDQVMTPADQNYLNGLAGQQPAATPPEVKPNPYAEQYNKFYSQIMQGTPGTPEKFARQQALSAVEQMKSADQANTRITMEDQQQDHDAAVEENTRRTALGLQPLPVPPAPQTQPPPAPVKDELGSGGPQDAQNAQNRKAIDNSGIGLSSDRDPQNMLEAGYQNKLAGIAEQQQGQIQIGNEQAQALDQSVKDQNTAKEHYLQTYRDLDNERQNLVEDIKNGHIDPEKYWDNHSKIAAGIGMILAGFNPTNSPNAAVNFLKFQMEQNLQSQMANLNSKQNLLSHNLQQFGNLRDAATATNLMQNQMLQYQLQDAAAKAATPMAKAAALQAQGQLQMEAAPMFQQFALRRAMMTLANNSPNDTGGIDHLLGYMRVVNPEMAKEMQSRYVPNVGLASVSVPDKVRDELTNRQTLNQQAQDLMEYSKNHTNLVPGTAEYNYGVAKAKAFQQTIREGLLNTVYRESEAPLLQSMAGEKNPAGLLKMLNTQPRVRAVIDSNALGLNVLKRNYGLPVAAPAPQIMTKHGAQYQKVQNGWKRIK